MRNSKRIEELDNELYETKRGISIDRMNACEKEKETDEVLRRHENRLSLTERTASASDEACKKISLLLVGLSSTVRSQGEQLAKLEFMVSNPAKYKKGQKMVGPYIITSVELKVKGGLSFESGVGVDHRTYHWSYNVTNTSTGELKIISEVDIKSK
jgi:hypothetical protein